MGNQIKSPGKGLKFILIISLIISGTKAAAGVVIMTDLGQLFGVSKQTVVSYFQNISMLILISFLALLGALIINYRIQFIKKWVVMGLSVLWIFAVLSTSI